MGKFIGKITVAVALAGGLAVTSVGTAYAAGSISTAQPSASSGSPSTGQGLAAIKARAAAAVSLRLSALNRAIPAVESDKWISASDQPTLLATLNSDVSGLTALGSRIQSDTTSGVALSDYRTIFTDYRVFALALPQARFAAACDDITGGVLPRLQDAQSKLQSLLSGVDSGKDSSGVQAAMADLGSQISAISSATSDLAATVLGYTPSDYDADPGILAGPKSTLLSSRADVKAARDDIATVVAALR